MISRKASVHFIFATIFIDMMGIGLIIPTLPDVIRRFGTSESFVSEYYGYFVSVYALMQLLMSPLLGALSDRFGRRPILLISLLGAGLDYIMMAFAPTLSILFIGRIISGLTGANVTVATSYIADVSDDNNRAANFGLIGAAFGLGFIFGPLLGGLLGSYGAHIPFLAAAFLNLLNFAFGMAVLPESLPPELRRPVQLKRLNPFNALLHAFSRPGIMGLIWIHFFFNIAGLVYPNIWTLFVQHKFQWTPFQVGLSLSLVGLSAAAVQGLLTRVVVPRFGEIKAIIVGLMIQAVCLVAFAQTPDNWILYVVILVSSLAGLAGPSLHALLTQRVPSSEQGELQGSIVSVTSLASIIAPLLYTRSFEWGIQHKNWPELPFYVAVGVTVLCLGILMSWKHSTQQNLKARETAL